MKASIHNPERVRCETMYIESREGYTSLVEFECEGRGSVTMFFNSPDDLRNHATAMKLLAEKMEEEQAK